jgi:hypothetical protein
VIVATEGREVREVREMAIEAETRPSRRNILVAGLGALGGLVAAGLGRPAAVMAAANGNVQLSTGVGNSDNDAATETRVNVTGDGQIAFSAVQAQSGTGVYGYALTGGEGVRGLGGDTATGVSAQSTNGTGARSASTNDTPTADFSVASNKTGLIGTAGDIGTPGPDGISINTDETGVYGYSNVSFNSVGVAGKSIDGTGVLGFGFTGVIGIGDWGVLGDVDVTGIGVYGSIGPSAAPAVPAAGVVARSELTNGVALRVLGRTSFSFSGRATVAAHKSSVKVPKVGVTSASLIVATPKTNRAGVYVQSVVPTTGSFTIYLNKAVSGTTYVAYLILN